jgi:hypothetical protein
MNNKEETICLSNYTMVIVKESIIIDLIGPMIGKGIHPSLA